MNSGMSLIVKTVTRLVASFITLFGIYIVLYVLFGGTQTVIGPLVGAIFFTLLPEILRDTEVWRYVIFAAAIILLMIWRPSGLISRSLIDRLLGRGREINEEAEV